MKDCKVCSDKATTLASFNNTHFWNFPRVVFEVIQTVSTKNAFHLVKN